MTFRFTVRYGVRSHRYHTMDVEASDVAAALREAADALPPEVAAEADLVEMRVATPPDDRVYLGEEEG